MNELTKREQIALAMLQGKPDIIISNEVVRFNYLTNAFAFADLFLSISEDTTGKSIDKIEECPICFGTGNKLNSINPEHCFNCGGTGKIAVMENLEARR